MADDLVLKSVRVHPQQRTLLCPYCGTEGRNWTLSRGMPDKANLPGECPECGEHFIIKTDSSNDLDTPLLTAAVAILECSKEWDSSDPTLLKRMESNITAILKAIPGISRSELPVFEFRRNNDGNAEFIPKNNTALRVLELMDDYRRSQLQEPEANNDKLQGV